MTTPTPETEADDDDLELPPLGGTLGDDEDDYRPDDDEDLGLSGTEGGEDVGLDVEAGIDEPIEAELGAVADDESTRWTEGSEADESLDGADADLIEGEEYGWTGDDEPAGFDDFDDDELPPEEGGQTLVDRGEEGLVDDGLAEEIGELPPLDQDVEDAEEDPEEAAQALEAFDLALLDEQAEGSLEDEEALVEVVGGASWPALAAEHVRVERLLSLDGDALQAAWGGDAVLFHDGRLWRASVEGGAEQQGALSGTPVCLSLAGDSLAVGVAGAILGSRDGGRSVERLSLPAGLPKVRVEAAWTQAGREGRLWAAPVDGPLLSAVGEGQALEIVEPDARVLTLASDGRRALARVLRAADGSAVVERSTDEGESWEAWRAPVESIDGIVSLDVVRDVVIVARSAPTPSVLYVREQGPWHEALPGGQAPACLVDEERDALLYACVHGPESTFVVRRPLSDAGRLPKIVAELPLATHGRPRAIAAGHEEGRLVLWVVTQGAWLRITARLDVGAR